MRGRLGDAVCGPEPVIGSGYSHCLKLSELKPFSRVTQATDLGDADDG